MKLSCASWIGRDFLSRYRKSRSRIKADSPSRRPFEPTAIYGYLPNA